MLVMVLRNEMIATVFEPIGRKANWSENDRAAGSRRRAG